ncbi:MAG TPA: hypothetical protein VJL81_03845 [Solirubrobacterales bacterium]|nr:hypothetical protein [Solirubrobacterales bacterium]
MVKAIERGRTTEEEYLERECERQHRTRAEMVRRVPPEVEAEGAGAVEVWTDEWLAKDLRWVLRTSRKRGPREPLDYAEMHNLGRI